jgi:Uma2 family endonuclease
MSAVFDPLPPEPPPPGRGPLTVADLAALPSVLPSGPVRYELNNGGLVVMAPPGGQHGSSQGSISGQLKLQGEWRGLGKAWAEVAVILWRNPDRVVAPDAAFLANFGFPFRYSPEAYLETIPHLAVEIRSKNDTQPEIDQKVADYFKAGVLVVWVADPVQETITEYRPGVPMRVYAATDILTIEDVIPGFQMTVRQAF